MKLDLASVCVWTACLALAACSLPRSSLGSGLRAGDDSPAFDPVHVWGPDRGSHACPMCKYGNHPGVLLWVNSERLDAITPITRRLDEEVARRSADEFRAFIIFTNPAHRTTTDVEARLTAWAERAGLRHVAVAHVPSPTDSRSAALYRLNPDPSVSTVAIVYDQRKVVATFTNVESDQTAIAALLAAVDRAEASSPSRNGSR